MSISTALLRSETLEHLGIEADDLDASGSANIDLLINRSWWEIADEFDFKEKEQTTTFPTVAGTRNYTIVTAISPLFLEAVQDISYTDPNTLEHISLNRTNPQWYEENYNEQSSMQAAPTKWFHNNGYLYLYPTPDQIYTITLWYNSVLPDLSGSVNPTIPQNWHEAILYGAVKRGFLRARDYNSAQLMDREQRLKIQQLQTTDAKEDKEDHMAGVRVLRPGYNVRH